MRRQAVLVWAMAAVVAAGCSREQKEQAGQALDYGTGKTQVKAYQQMQHQIRAIRRDEAQQLDDATQR